MEKVYDVPRKRIIASLISLLEYQNISATNKQVLIEALKIFNSENIDFVDAILVAYNHESGAIIHSFDQKIIKLCR